MIAGYESKTVRVRLGCRRDETVHSPERWMARIPLRTAVATPRASQRMMAMVVWSPRMGWTYVEFTETQATIPLDEEWRALLVLWSATVQSGGS
jgi:hypothetical protein